MLRLDPAEVQFRDVQLHQAYTAALTLTNTLNSPVDCSIKTTAPARYTVTPDAVRLEPGKSCTVQIRLYVQHFPNSARGRQGHKDTLLIKSAYFEQKADVVFFLAVQRNRETTAQRSKSLSPKRSRQRRQDSSLEMSPDTLASSPKEVAAPQVDVQAILMQKNRQITELQALVEQLQSEHPSIQEIVATHIAKERHSFEEKSEKILKILKRKDDTITQLQSQLQSLQLQRDECEQQKGELAQQLQTLQELHQKSERPHVHFSSTNAATTAPAPASSIATQNDQAQIELEDLQTKCADQTEQIEVLVTEVARLRNEIASRNSAQEEFQQLRTELARARAHVEELKQINAGLEQSFRAHRESTTEQSPHEPEGDTDTLLESNHPGNSATLDVLRASLRQERNRCHEAEAQTIALRQQLTAKGQQYAELRQDYQKLEDVVEKLQTTLKDREQQVNELKEQLHNSKADLLAASAAGEEQGNDVQVLRSKCSDLEAQLRNQATELQEALHKLSVRQSRMGKQDAHQWWSYVWHMCKQEGLPAETFHAYPDTDSPDVVRDLKLAKYENTIREQAAQLVLVRQQLLAQNLAARREVEHCTEKLEQQAKEITRLQHQLRTNKSNGEVRLTELQNTVRVLSGRSELHAQVALLRQDLEGERVCSNQLQSDVNMYKELLQRTQANVANLERRLRTAQELCDTHQVLGSVQEVPGVDPATLLEEFSAAFIRLQRECSTLQTNKRHVSTAGHATGIPRNGILSRPYQDLEGADDDEADDDDDDDDDDAGVAAATAANETLHGDCSEPTTIRNVLHAMRYPQTALDYEKVLEALGSGMLGKQVWVMEQQFQVAQSKMDERTQQLLDSEKGLMQERDSIASELQEVRRQFQRRFELLEIECKTAKQTVATLRDQNKSLASTVQQLELAATFASQATTPTETADVPPSKDARTMTLDAELRKLKSTLKEKTAQIQVLTETIETLQMSISATPSNTTIGSDEFIADNTQYTSWALQALVRRVVALTNELSMAHSAAGTTERQLQHMEEENLKTQAQAELFKQEQIKQARLTQAYQVEAEALRLRVAEIEQANRVEENRLQQEIDGLRERVLEESQRCKQLTLVADEYEQFRRATEETLKLATNSVDMFAATATADAGTQGESHDWRVETEGRVKPPEAGDSSVRQLISSLLLELRRHSALKAQRQQGAPHLAEQQRTGPKKSEKAFFHRVIELVLGCHQKCLDAETYGRKVEVDRALLQNKLAILEHNFRSNMHTLHVQNSKLVTLQAANDQLQEQLLRQGLTQFNEVVAANTELQQRITELARTGIQTRYEHRKASVILARMITANHTHQQRLAELEHKLVTTMDAARLELLQTYQSLVSDAEQRVKKWFEQELPRLISGLPITEDMYASRPMFQADVQDQANNASMQRLSQLDLDSTYALAQALCAVKATLAGEQLRVAEYEQQLLTSKTLLREMRAELARVQDNEPFHASITSWLQRGFEKVEAEVQELQRMEESVARLELSAKEQQTELQEQIRQKTAALEQSMCQVKELRDRVQQLQEEVSAAQQQHSQQLARQRVELNSKHAQELRAVKESYEQEKFELVNALEEVSSATVDLVNQEARPALDRMRHVAQQTALGPQPSDASSSEDQGGTETAHTRAHASASESLSVAKEDQQKAALAECHALLHESTETITELQAQLAGARRSLAMEQARVEDYQDQVRQLEQIVAVQREQMQQERSGGQIPGKQGDEEGDGNPHFREHVTDTLEKLQRVVDDEDPELWPTSTELVEEAVHILSSCVHMHQAEQQVDNDVRSALLMILRARKALSMQLPEAQSLDTEASDNVNEMPDIPPGANYRQGFAAVNNQLKQLEEDIQKVDRASVVQSARQIVSQLHDDLELFISSREAAWRVERESLHNEQRRLLDELQSAKHSATTQAMALKERYEKALREVEEALELQRDATQCELDRLQTEVQRLNTQLSEKDTALHQLEQQTQQEQVQSQQHQHRPQQLHQPPQESQHHQHELKHDSQQLEDRSRAHEDAANKTSLQAGDRQSAAPGQQPQGGDQERMQELERQVSRLHDLLERSADSTFITHKSNRTSEQQHEEEIKQLKKHFQKFSEAQNAIVKSLEEQLADMQHTQPQLRSTVLEPEMLDRSVLNATLLERDSVIAGLRSQLRRLQSQYRVKTAELDSLLGTVGLPFETSNGAHRVFPAYSTTGSGDRDDSEISSEQYSSPTAFAVITEARNAAIDKELEALHRLVDRHTQQEQELSRQLELAQARHDRQESNQYKNAPSRVHVLLQRLNEVKKKARAEIAALKSQVSALEAELPSKEEIRHLRRRTKELQDTVQLLREDNNRKSKLLSALRQGRHADESAVEHWKLEAARCDSKAKELARTLASKDAMIQQLRAKLEELENQPADRSAEESKEDSEAALRRLQNKCNLLQSKIRHLEADRSKLQQAVEQSNRSAQQESSKEALQRKDAAIQSLRVRLTKVKEEYDNHREKAGQAALELERKLSAATRKLEDREKRLAIIDKEHSRARDRLQSELEKATEQASSLRQCLIHTVEQVYAHQHVTRRDSLGGLDEHDVDTTQSKAIDSEEIVVPSSIGLSAGEVSEILSAVQGTSQAKSRRRGPELPSARTAKQRNSRSAFMEKLTRLVTESVDIAGVSDLVRTLLLQ